MASTIRRQRLNRKRTKWIDSRYSIGYRTARWRYCAMASGSAAMAMHRAMAIRSTLATELEEKTRKTVALAGALADGYRAAGNVMRKFHEEYGHMRASR